MGSLPGKLNQTILYATGKDVAQLSSRLAVGDPKGCLLSPAML